jgi:hypothetical protein
MPAIYGYTNIKPGVNPDIPGSGYQLSSLTLCTFGSKFSEIKPGVREKPFKIELILKIMLSADLVRRTFFLKNNIL